MSKSPQLRPRDHVLPLSHMQITENDPAGVRVLEVQPWIDLGTHLDGFELVSLSIGPSGELYALAVTAPADYREIAPSGAIFPKVYTERPHDACILRFDGSELGRFDIPDQHWNFSHVQPLPDDELLLVVSRSRRFSDDVYDLNGKVFAFDGMFKREFLLGDGIRDVQATVDGRIWVGYFDEGIFGGFGWREPVGKPGLVLWDRFGNRLFGYSPPAEFGLYGRMSDCYALNVLSDAETWCYYMNMAPAGDFPLIRLCNERIDATWQSPISGAHGIAVGHDHVLYCGRFRRQEEFGLYALGDDGQMHSRVRFNVVNEQGVALSVRRVTVRGSELVLRQGFCCYRLDLRALIHTV